jgi:hypothetical protein
LQLTQRRASESQQPLIASACLGRRVEARNNVPPPARREVAAHHSVVVATSINKCREHGAAIISTVKSNRTDTLPW